MRNAVLMLFFRMTFCTRLQKLDKKLPLSHVTKNGKLTSTYCWWMSTSSPARFPAQPLPGAMAHSIPSQLPDDPSLQHSLQIQLQAEHPIHATGAHSYLIESGLKSTCYYFISNRNKLCICVSLWEEITWTHIALCSFLGSVPRSYKWKYTPYPMVYRKTVYIKSQLPLHSVSCICHIQQRKSPGRAVVNGLPSTASCYNRKRSKALRLAPRSGASQKSLPNHKEIGRGCGRCV